jgi:hypothetical protein
MKTIIEYWLTVVPWIREGVVGAQHESVGPFRSRSEAERAMTATIGTGKFGRVALYTKTIEDEGEEGGAA